ncbi:unnamed protein product [Vitrella brassicaformis CCMP3155]|uniref:DNA mismatch repair protein S5 domain-containing protein n=2 Tax=Vitrella brassicaformis TaxID=1169539 RepID=A0A0G4GG84_VITBC|nr:unnamed protein product [Vitrella brassicaformis CCMP3155]|eukprot:CEM28625.1 unnamed protein product [Vitrella brassicaformis CCMP3155]
MAAAAAAAASSSAASSGGAASIHRLPECVVNRIAAGEVVVRPAAALKELIENSLDAKSTSIQIYLKQGGIKGAQITDDGSGIQPDDLPIVCERFTTSKISAIGDLRTVATFGFRGEALASLSHVAHVTITSKVATSPCAYTASYVDGKLADNKPPRACAGTQGTTIAYEDLFYNMPARRQALSSPGEETKFILDVVQKFAIHHSCVAFTVKKHGGNAADLSTAGGDNTGPRDVVSMLMGTSLARELMDVTFDSSQQQQQQGGGRGGSSGGGSGNGGGGGGGGGRCAVKGRGLANHANYAPKKGGFFLFINNRSVDCQPLKQSINNLYEPLLPRGSKPWVYLSLELPATTLDVNVHPTKREVKFLYQDDIISHVIKTLQSSLESYPKSRTFDLRQTTLLPRPPQRKRERSPPIDFLAEDDGDNNGEEADNEEPQQQAKQQPQRKKKSGPKAARVRTDPKQSSLRAFVAMREGGGIGVGQPLPRPAELRMRPLSEHVCSSTTPPAPPPPAPPGLSKLVGAVEAACSGSEGRRLSEVVTQSVWVGSVNRQMALLQYRSCLYLVNLLVLTRECVYQSILHRIGRFPAVKIDPPLPVSDLLHFGLHDPMAGIKKAAQDNGQDAAQQQDEERINAKKVECASRLERHSRWLRDYFAIDIRDGHLRQFPQCLRQYFPGFDGLPLWVLRLAVQVRWDCEEDRLTDICRLLTYFFVPLPPQDSNHHTHDDNGPGPASASASASAPAAAAAAAAAASSGGGGGSSSSKDGGGGGERRTRHAVCESTRRLMEDVWYKALRFNHTFKVPDSYESDRTIVLLTSLERLYKIFERC